MLLLLPLASHSAFFPFSIMAFLMSASKSCCHNCYCVCCRCCCCSSCIVIEIVVNLWLNRAKIDATTLTLTLDIFPVYFPAQAGLMEKRLPEKCQKMIMGEQHLMHVIADRRGAAKSNLLPGFWPEYSSTRFPHHISLSLSLCTPPPSLLRRPIPRAPLPAAHAST